MQLRRRIAVTLGSIGVLTLLALYPRTAQTPRTQLLSHGYGYGYGYGLPCPTSLTLGVNKFQVVSGQPFVAGGNLTAEAGFNTSGQPIKFFQAVFGATSFTQISGATTFSPYSKTMFPSKHATYKTQWGPLNTQALKCPAVNSGRATVRVLVRVPWLLGESPRRNNPVTIFGSVRPPHPFGTIWFAFKRLDDPSFSWRRATLDGNSNFFVPFTFTRTGNHYLRAIFYDPDTEGNFHDGNYFARIFNVGP